MKMGRQTTDTLLLIKPSTFGYNELSSQNNYFQNRSSLGDKDLINKAISEFNVFRDLLIKKGINVISVDYGSEEYLPDAVFPNNWFATFEDGTIIYFPLQSENRRRERKPEVLKKNLSDYIIKREIDLTNYEKEGFYLESTGSVVIDRTNNMAYACSSPRTSRALFDIFCSTVNIPVTSRIFFEAKDKNGRDIYHTNVVLSIGEGFCVICSNILSGRYRNRLISRFNELDMEIIEIDFDQMNNFCANVLHISDSGGKYFILMSERAFRAFMKEQISKLEKFGEIIYSDISTIEEVGGGSARCMVAEIFLPPKKIADK